VAYWAWFGHGALDHPNKLIEATLFLINAEAICNEGAEVVALTIVHISNEDGLMDGGLHNSKELAAPSILGPAEELVAHHIARILRPNAIEGSWLKASDPHFHRFPRSIL